MKIPKLKQYDIVKITWTDTHISTNPGWMDSDEHQEWVNRLGSVVSSVGHYISQDDKFIHIAGDVDKDDIQTRYLLRPINIVKGLITDIKVLK